MAQTYCPNCDEMIQVNNPRMGALINCSECGEELEVISVKPFEVDFPLDDDWDDDWDYEDEDWDDDWEEEEDEG